MERMETVPTRLRWTKGVRHDLLGIGYRVWETVAVTPGEDATYDVETNLAEYRKITRFATEGPHDA
jgi:hypothetical protein